TQSAPAARTLSTSSPRRAKSAERMDGAMTVGCMARLGRNAGRRASAALAQGADAVVGGVDRGGAPFGLLALLRFGAGDAVWVVLRHQPAVGLVDLRIAGIAGQAQLGIGVLAPAQAEPVDIKGMANEQADDRAEQ